MPKSWHPPLCAIHFTTDTNTVAERIKSILGSASLNPGYVNHIYISQHGEPIPNNGRSMIDYLASLDEFEIAEDGGTVAVKHHKKPAQEDHHQNRRQIVDTHEKLERFKSRIWTNAKGPVVIAIDCEGVPHNIYLIQVAGQGQTYLLDGVRLDKEEICKAVKELLVDPSLTKIMHDLKCDTVAFRDFGGINDAHNVIDTQLVMEHLDGKINHSMNSMLEFFNLEHPEKKEITKIMRETDDDSIFKQRPIPHQLVSYASNDVELLLDAYDRIQSELDGVTLERIKVASRQRYLNTEAFRRKRPVVFDRATAKMCSQEMQHETFSKADVVAPELDQDIKPLLEILPDKIRKEVATNVPVSELVDIVLDFGRTPYETSRRGGDRIILTKGECATKTVSKDDLQFIVDKVGPFNIKGRACLDWQLHRISLVKGRDGTIGGVTIRFGRHIKNVAMKIHDVLFGDPSKSVLILGEPGTGKTSLLRDIARLVSDRYQTCIIDTCNEIAGDGDVPHECIGWSRRFMVDSIHDQSNLMLEVVQNHTPEVLLLDEIGTKHEARAANTCRNRGVRLIASTHGRLESLVHNPDLQSLVGGVQSVILGDAALEKRTQSGVFGRKTVQEREGSPVFDIIVEWRKGYKHDYWLALDSAEAVDRILRYGDYSLDRRSHDPETGNVLD